MRLIMIRHARPEWRSSPLISLAKFERIAGGYDDAHLSAKGRIAVAALAERLPKAPILSSDLPRARETAEVIGGGDRTIVFDALFREVPNTRIGGGLLSRLLAPADVWAFIRRCYWIIGAGECPEKPRAAWRRAARATDSILERFEGYEALILVSHGWFLTMLALHLRRRRLIQRGPLLPRVSYGGMTVYHLQPEPSV